jgi:hypothetical protein
MKYVDIVQFIDEEEETMKKALKFMFFVTARGWGGKSRKPLEMANLLAIKRLSKLSRIMSNYVGG